MTVSVLAKISTHPGKRDDVVAALKPMLEHVESEPGTLVYLLHTDAKNPDLLWMYEVYADQASLETHSGSATMKALGPALAPFLAGRPELIFVSPIGGKGA